MKCKRISAVFFAVVFLVSFAAMSFSAYGSDVTWEYDSSNKTLYIRGSGNMDNFEDAYSSPWHNVILSVENIVIEQGVTSVGDYAFAGASSLASVSVADTVESIGSYAFSFCSLLKELTFPESVLSVADSSFAFDGVEEKPDFILYCSPGSYSLDYCVRNSINFSSPSVSCGSYTVTINPKGMKAYYPYTAKVSGTFKFYSTGNHDSKGWVYDSSMNELAKNDDLSSSDTNFSITYDLTEGETYYIAAKILNNSISGSFTLFIEPVEYSVNASICAAANPSGAPSGVVLTDSCINGEPAGGVYSAVITQDNKTVTVSCGSASAEYTFSPDNGAEPVIVLMVCDLNNDGIVNAKDYAMMKKLYPQYLELFPAFVNYRCP